MLNAKPTASLSPGLLARKGEARPAMRRQRLADLSSGVVATDDLGWNDMGEGDAVAPDAVRPPVLEQRRQLAHDLAQTDMPDVTAGRRTAFTLRLDAERHLRLRLASAAQGRSAQKLVIEALDAFLATQPEVAALHARLAGAQQPIKERK